MSPSKMRKTRAYAAGASHADGGDDRRENFKPKQAWRDDHRPAYDLGYREHSEHLARQAHSEDDPYTIIRNLLEHSVYDRERSDECIEAVEAAERYLGQSHE